MSAQASDAYLESLARTATPQRLRLMLIDGAIRDLATNYVFTMMHVMK